MSAAASNDAALGFHLRVPFAEYVTLQGVNISSLKAMAVSPKLYRHRLDNPLQSKAMTLGSASHTAVLEPHRFLAEYALWNEQTDGGKTRPRRGKDFEAFEACNTGKRIITADEYQTACAIRDAVRSHPPAMKYLRDGDAEVTMRWLNQRGTLCRGRVDWLTKVAGEDVIVGLKTARDCGPVMFGNQCVKLGYVEQFAFYRDGFETLTGRVPRVVEIVAESAPPHDVAVYFVPDEVLEVGRDTYLRLMDRLAICTADDSWPGQVEGEMQLSLPAWAFPKDDDDIDGLGLTGFEEEK